MSNVALAAEHVSFAYTSQLVLQDVTARIGHAALVGILGPNGSGKTTLLRLLAGLLLPARGEVRLGDVDLRSLRRSMVARRLAMVPQETQLAFDYTVLEMAVMGRYPHLGAFEVEGPSEIEIAREALRATGTQHLESRPFNTLSGGEKQRVVIAGALAQLSKAGPGASISASSSKTAPDPDFEILLLDEPTASLDLAYQLEIRSILVELNRSRNLTIVVSTHDLNFAAGLCRELILVDRGHVLATGPTETMLEPALIRQLYGVDVEIANNVRAGHRTVVPIARAHDAHPS
jgi:iron complex transport system ATP-binding protein